MAVHDNIIMTSQSRKDDMLKGSKKVNGKIKKITIRLTESDYKEFFEKAKIQKMNMSDYVRYLVKKDKLKN